MTRARIVATGAYLPGEPLTNDDLERLAGPLDEVVLAQLGVQQRHWIADPATGAHRETNSQMAMKAARQVLETAGAQSADVDMIVVSTGTPDQLLPPMVATIQERLGLERSFCLELRSAGAGTVQGLDIARLYIESGVARTALVIGSEAISPVLVPMFRDRSPDDIRMRDRVAIYFCGDGAGAFLLSAGDGEGGIHAATSGSVGGRRKPGVQTVGGGTETPFHEQAMRDRFVDLRIDLTVSAEAQPPMMLSAVHETLARADVDAGSVSAAFIPGGSAPWINERLGDDPRWTGLRPSLIDDIPTTGAIGSAYIPVSVDRAWRSGRIGAGDEVLMIGLEATKWMYAGVAALWTATTPGMAVTGEARVSA